MSDADPATLDSRLGEPHRPSYHFTPRSGWMNDPNGLVYFEGEWHLFFQHNPDAPTFGRISWGHAVSADLVRWRQLPVAIAPSERLGWAFSGSAVVDRDDRSERFRPGEPCIVAAFTHAFGEDGAQKQSLAFSHDRGRSFVEYEGNPVLANPGVVDFRDPKLLWHAGSERWVMALAVGDRARFYTSSDLVRWTQVSELGPFESIDGVWECPDLFPLPLGGAEKWVFKFDVNAGVGKPGSRALALVGSFDGEHFVPETAPPGRRIDFGPDFYAAQVFANAPGGRRVWLAWRDNWHYALSAPTDPWRGSMTIPRELSLVDAGDGPRLVQRPIAELRSLRGARPILSRAALDLAGGPSRALAGVEGDALEIVLVLEPGDAVRAGVAVRVGESEETLVGYDRERGVVFVDRRRSGNVLFAPGFSGRYEAPVALRDGAVDLTIFVDRSSVEVFADGGRAALSANIFPKPRSVGIATFAGAKGARIRNLEIERLGSAFLAAP